MNRVFGKDGTPSGIGNQVSVEFNLAYRWHSATSAEDEKWTDAVYYELFGKSGEEVALSELMMGLGKWEHDLPKDPSKREFAHLKRQADGTFNDDDLVKIMMQATESVAGWHPDSIMWKQTMLIGGRVVWSTQCSKSSSRRRDSWHAAGTEMELRLPQRVPKVFWLENLRYVRRNQF